MKKMWLIFLTLVLFIFFFGDKVDAASSLSMDEDNDYELVCTYEDNTKITISRDDVFIENTSNSINSTSSSGIKFFLTEDQENDLYSENGSVYRHSNITENGKCPSKLYVYDLPTKYDDNSETDNKDNKSSTLYYSTKNNIATSIGGTHLCWFFKKCDNATQIKEATTNLVSEEVYLITAKEAKICDYKTPSVNGTDIQVASIFLYDNMTIIESNGRFTTLDETWESCEEKPVYINNSSPIAIADDGDGVSSGTRFNYKRFFVSTSSSDCKKRNDGKMCSKFEFLGDRTGNSNNSSGGKNVCEVLGNDTINELKKIIGYLQFIVPVLTIALTGFDIGKIVLSGNIDEELPKKKKVIITRLIIMAFFFFLPLITDLLLNGLKNAGVVGVEKVDCITGVSVSE